MINIAILASGSGSNAENIVHYFSKSETIQVAKILSNKKDAFVLERAKNLKVPSAHFTREEFRSTDFLKFLDGVDYLVLAGFLWLVPSYLVEAFPNKIINIHPSLLPKYGGKGMYGARVHEAVIAAKEKGSGITIHLVNERYDEGEILFQICCAIADTDTPGSLADKIHELEYKHFPKVIERCIISEGE